MENETYIKKFEEFKSKAHTRCFAQRTIELWCNPEAQETYLVIYEEQNIVGMERLADKEIQRFFGKNTFEQYDDIVRDCLEIEDRRSEEDRLFRCREEEREINRQINEWNEYKNYLKQGGKE